MLFGLLFAEKKVLFGPTLNFNLPPPHATCHILYIIIIIIPYCDGGGGEEDDDATVALVLVLPG